MIERALSDDDEDDDVEPDRVETETHEQKKLCLCAPSRPMETQEAGLMQKKASTSTFPCNFHPIIDDYTVSHEVGI